MEQDADIIIVGAGGSGLAAAVSAAENGASVIVLEKRPLPGGTTGIAVGSFTANRTAMQRREGIDDNPEDHEADAAKFGPPEHQARNNRDLRLHFLGHTAETLDWLQGMGLRFHGPSPEPPNRVPRMHNVVPSAKAYIAVLQSRLLVLGGRLQCNATVQELMRDGGRVVGVVADVDGQSVTFRAGRGVVLAAGDYTNSASLIEEYKGAAFREVEGINPHSTGDGHRLALQAGAELLNMDITYGPEIRFVAPPRQPFAQLLPATGLAARIMGHLLPLVPKRLMNAMIKRLLVTWQHPEEALFDDGAILVNGRGERFCNEQESPAREIAIAAQPEKQAYILLDQRVVQRYSAWPHFISTAPEIAYAYVADYQRLRPDVTVTSPRLDDLTAARAMDPQVLRDTVEAYNRYVAGEVADPHGRTGDTHPLQDGDWALLGPARAYFTTTEGGVRINQDLQALDTDGHPIEGLYAIGQNGLGGMVLWGHGLHIGWAITSGRLVGRLLAKHGV
jgi:fumarate reductase flavoprotein subunit